MKLTRIIALLLMICFLVGCGQQTEAPSEEIQDQTENSQEPIEQFVFTRENFPRIDGSTSTVPLGEAIASVLLGETREEVSDLIQFSKTTQSYRSLMWGDADILIAAEPAETIWEENAENGFKWEMEPFAVDGLVFIVNKDNPIDSLTIEQVQKIYSGEITNWSEVGGNDLEIIPFQRNEEAGSQTAMLKHVMKDIPMMDAPKEYFAESMFGLLNAVSAYDNSPAAIGYTMYYYAEDMKMADGLKIIAIDGVEPNDETIRSGEYPFLNNYYVLTAAGLSDDNPAKIMFDWILSEEGQRLVAHEGYVSVIDLELTEPVIQEGLSPVYTDWSKLTSYEEKSSYSYFEPRSEDGYLRPRDDYGALLPYLGIYIPTDGDGDHMLYGLVTTDGRIVTEPVYNYIEFEGEFMVLTEVEYQAGDNAEYDESDSLVRHYSIAAADGSWIKECESYPYVYSFDNYLVVEPQDEDSLITLNDDGEIVSEFHGSVFKSHFGKDFEWHKIQTTIENGIVCLEPWFDNDNLNMKTLYLDVINGKVLDGLREDNGWSSSQLTEHENATSDLVSEIRDDYFCYYSQETGELVFSYPIQRNID